MTSNEKTQNYKVVDLVESYNFHIEIIFVQILMNKYDSSKVRSCHADEGWHDKTILLCRLEWRDKFDMWIYTGRLLSSALERANVVHFVKPMHIARQHV